MAILSNTGIAGFLSSAKATGKQILNKAGKLVPEYIVDFASGFAGHGWKIWKTEYDAWRLETDELVIRRTMTVFELLISKIRCIKGALNISQGNGKIKTVELKDGNWYITIEDEMSFVAHDFIRCQHFGNQSKFYWVEVSDIIDNNTTLVIPATEFIGSLGYKDGMELVLEGGDMNVPEPGDEIIQFGNRENKKRQNAIYIHADEGGQPAIDVLFEINSKSFANCLKMRLGGEIPGANGLKGFYCENGMIKGVDETKHVVYQINPDGTAMFGDGSAQFKADKSGYIAGGAIKWEWLEEKNKFVCTMSDVILTWDSLSEDAKENLKGEKGDPGTDGEDVIAYSIEFEQDGRVINAIPALADGTPKIEKDLTAKLYKSIGDSKALCGDYYLSLICTEGDGRKYATSSFDLSASTTFSIFKGPISYTVSASPKLGAYPTDIVFSSTIDIVCDGQKGMQGEPGEPGTPGNDAEVPEWVKEWTTNVTEIDGKHIVSPQIFSGIKNEDGTLTGIIQGKECMTIDGELRTGIFALVDGKTVFELDPVNKKYKFEGRVEADEGHIGGMNIVDKSLRGTQAIFGSYQIVISTSRLDKNIVINNIDKQNSFIFEISRAIYDVVIILPSESDLIGKGLDNYQFELTLAVAYDGMHRRPLLINLEENGVEIIHNYNIHATSFVVAAGSVLKLLYLSGKYYLISTSDLDYTKVVLSKVP